MIILLDGSMVVGEVGSIVVWCVGGIGDVRLMDEFDGGIFVNGILMEVDGIFVKLMEVDGIFGILTTSESLASSKRSLNKTLDTCEESNDSKDKIGEVG